MQVHGRCNEGDLTTFRCVSLQHESGEDAILIRPDMATWSGALLSG